MKKVLRIKILVLVTIIFAHTQIQAQAPGKKWKTYKNVEDAGWSAEKLSKAKAHHDTIPTSAVMVINKEGNVIAAWGEYEREFIIHSCRKSFISALYGIYSDRGEINTSKTLGDLEIKSDSPLTDIEKTATVLDLLKARSGVYIPAAAEAPSMSEMRPKRGSHKPGEFWYYNNWDFNVLGTILEKETGNDVFEAMYKELALPLNMQGFEVNDGFFARGPQNEYDHPAYVMKMRGDDMARFGLLFLNNGKWNDKQIISEKWIRESIKPHSTDLGRYEQSGMGNYGYLWWLNSDFEEYGMYEAAGAGGHFISVFPKAEIVIVQRVNTYERNRVRNEQKKKLYELILDSKIGKHKSNSELIDLKPQTSSFKKGSLSRNELTQFVNTFDFGEAGEASVLEKDGILIFQSNFFPFTNPKLIPLEEKGTFLVEDFLYPIRFSKGKNGSIKEMILGDEGPRQLTGLVKKT